MDGEAASGVREVRRCLLGESVGVFCGFQLKYLDSCSPIGKTDVVGIHMRG